MLSKKLTKAIKEAEQRIDDQSGDGATVAKAILALAIAINDAGKNIADAIREKAKQ